MPLNPDLLKQGIKAHFQVSPMIKPHARARYQDTLNNVLTFFHKEAGIPVQTLDKPDEATMTVFLFHGLCDEIGKAIGCTDEDVVAMESHVEDQQSVIVLDKKRIEAAIPSVGERMIQHALKKFQKTYPGANHIVLSQQDKARLVLNITRAIETFATVHEFMHAFGFHNHFSTLDHPVPEGSSFFFHDTTALVRYVESHDFFVPHGRVNKKGGLPVRLTPKVEELSSVLLRSDDPAVALLKSSLGYYKKRNKVEWAKEE